MTDWSSKSRASTISPLLNDFDVVILNEAFVNKKHVLSKTTHPHIYTPPRPYFSLVSSGLMFISKFEITTVSWEQYRKASGVDLFAAKGIGSCIVRVERNGIDYGHLQVFGTHMQAGASHRGQVARHAQAAQAAEFVKVHRLLAEPSPAVFMGDLNMGPRHPVFGRFSVHYVDRSDAESRSEAYERLVASSGLKEARCDDDEYVSDICRFLYHGLEEEDYDLKYVDHLNYYHKKLSDTKAMCMTIALHGPTTRSTCATPAGGVAAPNGQLEDGQLQIRN
ncbi:hypothetical protein MMC09_002147 [Bachmanniomyces sp. S44760]|nr:hypothetical protein [Bachmanniomyces sp. S44760]